MAELRLDGVEVCLSFLTQRSYRAAACGYLLPITPQNRDQVLEEFRRGWPLGRYSGLRISGIADLSFLAEFEDLLYLEVVDQKRVNARHLEPLSNLRGLRLESPGAGVDFAWFPHLEVYVGDWHPEHRNVAAATELRQLRVWQFKPASADLSDLAGMKRLERLEITQTNVASLAGIQALEDLRYLEVSYASQLTSLDAFTTTELGIRELGLSKCSKVESYQPLSSLRKLRRLRLSGCAPMPDLKWTAGMDRLDFFSFVETDVKDGDLSPLLKLPRLEYVGSMNKRHYNYRCEELNEMLAQRQKAQA